ncbi:LOW QUALITY PROTEIN: hypothetical protein BRARA_F01902 [Brassica rapa]|uniref:DUF1985 domain-containing protein n=1 Tax=Brassica campestris TaxID=3711 RepID=A0A397YYU5_BRACM|nr:LOW QUALITY PROTEIN: hypothetical protein BRARA_F01902 [Brassica rapa]
MVPESGEASTDEANPSTIDKSVAPETDPRDADESEENASEKEEEKELSEKEEEEESIEVKEDNEGEEEKKAEDKEKEVREEEKEPKEELVDDEEEGMQPLKLHFPSSQYQKYLKLSRKCYIDTVIRNIQTILTKEEVEWFIEHPQFQHFFHIKNRKQKWMGMWLLVLRSACVAKKYELWFIVNGVPIRYSLKEIWTHFWTILP